MSDPARPRTGTAAIAAALLAASGVGRRFAPADLRPA